MLYLPFLCLSPSKIQPSHMNHMWSYVGQCDGLDNGTQKTIVPHIAYIFIGSLLQTLSLPLSLVPLVVLHFVEHYLASLRTYTLEAFLNVSDIVYWMNRYVVHM